MNYTKTEWQDLPDTSTPITADRLNNMENGIEYLFENGVGSGGESLPVGTEVDYTGEVSDIPTGWQQISPIMTGQTIKVSNSTAQTLAKDTTQTINFDTVIENTCDKLSLTNNGIVIGSGINTVLVNGRYTVSAIGATKYAYIFKNNSAEIFYKGNDATMTAITVLSVEAGDVIYLSAYQESASEGINITSAYNQTQLQVTVLN